MTGGWRRALAVARAAWRQARRRPKPPRRTGAELEFLPGALEIVEAPPSPLRRGLAVAIMAFLSLAIAWSWYGTLDVVAVAAGKVIPSGKVKIIQPVEIGIVRAIRVKDGERVRAGQVLIELDATISGADRERLHREVAAARVDAARLRAVVQETRGVQAFEPPAGTDPALVARHRALLVAQLREHEATMAALGREIERRQAEQGAVRATVQRLEKTVPLVRDRADSHGALAREGYVARLAYVELQQQLIEQEQDLQAQRHRLEEVTAAIDALEEQRRRAHAEFQRAALAQLADVETRAVALQQELVKAEQRHGLQRLVAPDDGVVQQLAVHTVGGVVTPAQPLLVLVPAGGDLEIEALILNKDVGFVRAGQEAAIKLETFPFTKYGTIPGRVQHVSGDAIPDEKVGLVYAARVALGRRAMLVDGVLVPLAPGMAATVEIKTDQRRVIEYLLSPILRYRQESLRER